MIHIRINYDGIDLSGRAMRKRLKNASVKAFEKHKTKTMKKKFTMQALQMYRSFKKPNVPKVKSRNASFNKKSRFKNSKTSKPRGRRRGNKLPLVETGRLKNAVINGYSKIFGPAGRTKIVWPSLPHYAYINPHNQINKKDALEEITINEQFEFSRDIDQFLQEELKT